MTEVPAKMLLVISFTAPQSTSATYLEKHPDGTWWLHYTEDDGTAPPIPMQGGPHFWRLTTSSHTYDVNDHPDPESRLDGIGARIRDALWPT